MPATKALPAMLSQLLVAFTLEFDNEFERQMSETGYPGARLSLIVWSNLIRFVGEGLSVSDLAAAALAPANRMKAELGCLERWGFITLVQDPAHRRDGWGSGRGIRADWIVRLNSKGLTASRIWPPLSLAIQQRWETRFGAAEIKSLRNSLYEIANQFDIELPQALPAGLEKNDEQYPARVTPTPTDLPLPALLSQLLLVFRLEFERESPAALALCANTLRILGDEPIPAREIPVRTGASPETSGIGWQLKPYIVTTPSPGRNQGQMVRLSPRGLVAQQKYYELTAEIEKSWHARFGAEKIGRLIDILRTLLDHRNLAEGLIPPKGTVRAGDQTPALGRRDVGSAARQRMRDLVAQTEAFVRDPAGTLPHYPLWDMNRGFGP